MYEVGSWFVYLMNGAILAIMAFILLVMVQVKRAKHAKDSEGKIRGEVQLSTGWSEYHIVPCGLSDKSVQIGNFVYMLDPDKRKWGKHPMNPFMGLSALQVPIRIEAWEKDNPEPIRSSYEKTVATSAEIKAMLDEHTASVTAMGIQELDSQHKVLMRALANQPNKNYVYIGLGLCAIVGIVNVVYMVQLVAYITG